MSIIRYNNSYDFANEISRMIDNALSTPMKQQFSL